MSQIMYHTFKQNPSLKQLKAESDKRREAEKIILPLLPKALRGHVHVAHMDQESLTLVADPRHAAVYWLRYQEDIILKNIKEINSYKDIAQVIIRFAPQADAAQAPETKDKTIEAESKPQNRPAGLKTMWASLHQCIKDPDLKKTFGNLSK
jgi:hypothetical protein